MAPLKSAALRRLARTALGGRAGPGRRWSESPNSTEFGALLQQSHPSLGPMLAEPGRRRLLQLMAASLAFGGLTRCDRRTKQRLRRNRSLRAPTRRADADGAAFLRIGNTVRRDSERRARDHDRWPSDQDRGQSGHPWTRGGPISSPRPRCLGCTTRTAHRRCSISSVRVIGIVFQAAMPTGSPTLRAVHGKGLRLLTGPISSPTLIAQIAAMQSALPEMHWHVHAPAGRDVAIRRCTAGVRQEAGDPLEL